jgi:hypothetical protein
MHLTMASRMLVRVRASEREWNCRSSQLQLQTQKDSKWPVPKPISPIYRTREACITTTRLSSTGTRTSMTLTRCVFQTLGQAPLRLAALAFTLTLILTLTLPTLARTLARSHARINREPKSSRFRIITWGCSDSRPGRCSARPTCPRALFARPDSTLAHSRLSRSRACRALALSRSFVRQDHPFLLPHPSRADSVPFPGAPKESPRQDCKAGQRVDRPGTALVLERHERSLEHLVARRRVVLPRKYLLDRQRAVCVRT